MNLGELCSEFDVMNKTRMISMGICWLAILPLCPAAPEGYVIQWGDWNATADVPMPPRLVCSNAINVSAGAFHGLALRSDGKVYGWGGDMTGAVSGRVSPEPIMRSGIVSFNGLVLSNVVAIAAGRYFSMALKMDGDVVTWGENYIPKDLTNIVAIASGWSDSWALKRNGTIVGWVSDSSFHGYGQLIPVEGLSNIVAISVGPWGYGTRGVALRRDGTVATWGTETDNKEFTEPPQGLTNVIALAAGATHSLALKSDNTIVGWGWNEYGEATGTPMTNAPDGLTFLSRGPVRIGGQALTNATSIAASRGYSMVLKKDGTMAVWGRIGIHSAYVPEGLSNVAAIAAGENFCLAITTDSAVAERFRR